MIQSYHRWSESEKQTDKEKILKINVNSASLVKEQPTLYRHSKHNILGVSEVEIIPLVSTKCLALYNTCFEIKNPIPYCLESIGGVV